MQAYVNCLCGYELDGDEAWKDFLTEDQLIFHCPACGSIFEKVGSGEQTDLAFFRSQQFEAVAEKNLEEKMEASEDYERCVEVVFHLEGRRYLYLCPNLSVLKGDWVHVPVGKRQEVRKALVVWTGYVSYDTLEEMGCDWKLVLDKLPSSD